MKIAADVPKTNEITHLKLTHNGWTQIQEPETSSKAILLSIPFMLAASIFSLLIISLFSDITLKDFGISKDSLIITINLGVIVSFILLVIVHELLHLIFIPGFARSKKTTVGLTIWGGFVATEEELSRKRYLLVTLAPFVILTVIVPMLLGVFGLMTTTFKWLIFLNAIGSSVDLLIAAMILKQVPRGAILIQNGQRTYWKSA
ncbi:DUF3267 domain-containing protein [Mesobacillus subterraneus]|uniref:DUF3267 domain-containing protein n=1 Tax=Mesobacillus subterraneus TaxID=285983 RepID=A0A3R9KYP4_9BACI|nr:DUF3267 domain-containing protein [Mesobacillus subterraneus]RSD29081.1 DUF3267 domain-containing protein [Mesobacillus subterraneus]